MTPEAILPTLAEMFITVAGFSGLIVSVRPGRADTWTADQLLRVGAVIGGCLVAALCSVLPFALGSLFADPSVAWAVPLVLAGSTYLLICVLFTRAVIRGTLRLILPGVIGPAVFLLVLLSVASILSGAGLVLPFSSGLLVLLLAWGLVIGALTLASAVARAFLADPPAA